MSPLNEQANETFLLYIKQKCKALLPQDLTVCLLIDEIHLSSFFDYKGGSIVGAAHNGVNAALSAFVFMIKSVFF